MTEKTLEAARDMIAGFLKNRRLELGLTQAEVADRAGVARKTINAMEAGLFWLGMKQYLLICEALHLFPAITEMEADDTIANALRENWKAKPKAMTIEEALDMKKKRYNRSGQNN
jgi:transcriptional regulator with XRE-family HTH domain